MRKDRARVRGAESKGVLPDFAVGDYVLVARVRQSGITPKLMNTWTGPWRVVSKIGGHVHGVEYIVTGRSREISCVFSHMPMNRSTSPWSGRRYSIALRVRVSLTWRGLRPWVWRLKVKNISLK